MPAKPIPPIERPAPPPWEEKPGRPKNPPRDESLYTEVQDPSKAHLFREYTERHVGFRSKQQSTWLFSLVVIVIIALFVAAVYFKIWEWRPVSAVQTAP